MFELCLCLEVPPHLESRAMEVRSKVSPGLEKTDSPSHRGLAGFSFFGRWGAAPAASQLRDWGHEAQPTALPSVEVTACLGADLFYSSCIVLLKNVPRIDLESCSSY